jgi:hypothetical protein
MTDKWEAWIISRTGVVLHCSEVVREPADELIKLGLAPDATDVIRVNFQVASEVNDIKIARVLKNDTLYAIREFSNSLNHTKVGPGYSSFAFFVNKTDVVSSAVCTCGGWACYGRDVFVHSFDCDLRK